MRSERFQYRTYELTGEPQFMNSINHITPDIERLLHQLHPDVVKGKKSLIKKLTRLAIQYPKVPTFKNYLTTVHNASGNKEQAYKANHWLIKEHPDYLFGKLNLAAEYLEKNTPELVPEVLGEIIELKDLYPERNVFHIEEFLAFNAIAARYFVMVDEVMEAEKRLEMMQEVDAEHPKTLQTEDYLRFSMFQKAAERQREEAAFRKTVETENRRSSIQTTRPPEFNFPEEMQFLYDYGLDIDVEKLKSVLLLDRELLIKDLCTILNDSIVRFDIYSIEEEYQNKPLEFPIHALLLLAELNAEKVLDQILEVLRQDEDYVDFWFGDIMQEIMVPAIVNCGGGQLEQLLGYLKEPHRYTFTKCQVSEAVIKMGHFDSGRREEVLQWAGNLLDFHADEWNGEGHTDSDFIGLLIADLVDAKMHELLPKINKLFELQIVGSGICGDYESVKKDIYTGSEYGLEVLKWDLNTMYEKFRSYNFTGEREEMNHELNNRILRDFGFKNNLDDDYDDYQRPIVKAKKVGRNDLCPCGSGKKYKKCCIAIEP